VWFVLLCKAFNHRILYGRYAANIYTYYWSEVSVNRPDIHGVSPEEEKRKAMVGEMICRKGRFEAWNEKVRG